MTLEAREQVNICSFEIFDDRILGPSREFVRIWLRTRQPAEIQEAREPLMKAAWLVLAPQNNEQQ